MATRMGVKEFRDKFTSIARGATGPVVVTNHDRVIGYYTPTDRDPAAGMDWARFEAKATDLRRRLERDGIDVGARLEELGIEDASPFDDPWVEGNPGRSGQDVDDDGNAQR